MTNPEWAKPSRPSVIHGAPLRMAWTPSWEPLYHVTASICQRSQSASKHNADGLGCTRGTLHSGSTLPQRTSLRETIL